MLRRGFGLKLNSAQYREIAYQAILRLLDQEHAVLDREIEAKLADRPVTSTSPRVTLRGLDPHHLSNALNKLIEDKRIEVVRETTRGGSTIPVYALTDRRALRRETRFAHAAARKRLLQARYLSWTRDSDERPNLIGRGGETATHTSLQAASAALASSPRARRMLDKDEGGEVRRLFGADIPGGPIDDVAYLLVRDGQGSPRLITVLIEVKNLRHWLYPDDSEIFQLLDKATRLQIAHPDELIVPVLVCRQRQFLTHTMALDLGFFAVPTIIQPMLPHDDVSLEHFDEVRTELGYNLVQTTGPLDRLTQFFGAELPKYALYNARRWQEVARVLNSMANTLRLLRDPSSPWKAREQHMDLLRQAAATELGAEREWVGRIRDSDDTDEGAF